MEERIWRRSAVSYERVFAAAIGVSHRGKSALLERVLSDFGVEHSFVQAAARVKEHYGFEITTSAVCKATLKTARRAQNLLEGKCRQSFRVMPAEAKETIILKTELEPRISRINTDYQCFMKTESFTPKLDAFLNQILL